MPFVRGFPISSFMPSGGRRNTTVPRLRAGFSLMEIVIAVFIMAVVFIPLGTLIFGGVRGTEQSRTFATGVNFASDIMDRLLSHKVPFSAIVPDGGPAVTGGFKSGLKQAGFSARHAALEGIVGGSERVILRKGTRYEVYLFAGTYGDGVADKADFEKELTFAYFRNPWVEQDATVKQDVVLRQTSPKYMPYKAEGTLTVTKRDGSTVTVDPDDPRAQMAWPKLGGGGANPWEPTFFQVRSQLGSGSVGVDYPLMVRDQEFYKEKDGGLMKLVLGLRWSKGTSRLSKAGLHNTQEFWLVSYKAKLEDEE